MPEVYPEHSEGKQEKRRWRWRRWLAALLVLALLVAGARLALEPVLTAYVNRTLDRDPNYDGRIEKVVIRLWRGAYRVEGVRLDQVAAGVASPLLTLDALDLSIQWSALLKGRVVGEVELVRPVVTFIDGGEGGASQSGAGGPWLGVLKDLFPFRINRVTVRDGSLRLRSERGATPVVVSVDELEATVRDLGNINDRITPLVTSLDATARVMNSGDLELHVKLDPFSFQPTFNLQMRMLGLEIREVNDLARVYGGLDFSGGLFDLVVEAEADNGLVQGTVKPLIRNLDVYTVEDDGLNPFNAAYELLVGGAVEVLENQRRDQFGTLVDFEASSKGLGLNLFEVVGNVLYNAFVQAFLPDLRPGAAGDFRFTPRPVAQE